MLRYYIGRSDFNRILAKLLERSSVYAPVASSDRVYFENITEPLIERIVYDTPREIDPPKSFLFLARRLAAQYFGDERARPKKSVTIVGIKNCDARALMAYDKVMLEGDFADLFYKNMRENSLFIGSDCGYAWPTCFCTLVGLKPYSEAGVDINLSKSENGYVVDVITEKGRKFYNEFAYFFRDATIEEIADARGAREKTVSALEDQNGEFNCRLPIHEIIKGTLNSPAWRKITKYCTECGACNIACPSCTCFSFFDSKADGNFKRLLLWDACLKGAYGKVAGGANSRPLLHGRYNNRLQCKFDYSYDRLNMYTCTGCGRCIECCPAKIDMREAIRDLEKSLALSQVKLE